MPTFRQGDIVRVPFPYTDRNTRQHRPALVISAGPVGESGAMIWVAMITSAANRPWPGDHPIEDFAGAGLPIPSVVRPTKITTVETGGAQRIGCLSDALTQAALATIMGLLGVEA